MKKSNILIASAAVAAMLPFFALADTNYSTNLTGGEEVPSVETTTTGELDMQFAEDNSDADFTLEVNDGEAVTAAHLHCAPEGEDGPVVATLFGDVFGGFDVDGTLAQFTLTDANIQDAGETCETPITDIETLQDAITDGMIYANVHTVAYPDGEVRGQLSTTTSTSTNGNGTDDDDDDNGTSTDNGTDDDDDDNNGTSTDDNGTDDDDDTNGTSTDNGTDDDDDTNGTSTDDNGTDDDDDNGGTNGDDDNGDNGGENGDDDADTEEIRAQINELIDDVRTRIEEIRSSLEEELGLL